MPLRKLLTTTTALLTLTILGCGPFALGGDTTYEYEDEGRICFGDDPWMGDGSVLHPGETLRLTVVFNDCLSSSCTDFHDTACSIDIDDKTITVTSEGSYTDTTQTSRACTDDCNVSSASCEGPELQEGSYTLHHGDDTYEFVVPPDDEDTAGCLEP